MRNKYFSFLALILIAFSCTTPDEIMDDFQVHVNPTFFRYVSIVNVEDLNDPSAALPSNMEVSITGRDAALVYNIDGTKNFELNAGLLQLIIPSESEPQGPEAIEFSVTVSAPGYRGNSANFTVREGQYNLASIIQVLDLSSLPSGLNNSAGSGGVDPNTNTLSTPLVVSGATSDSTSSIEITIPADVKFLDANGNVIVGKRASADLNVNVLSLSDTSRAAQLSLPGGTGATQVVEDAGGNSDSTLFVATSTFDVGIDVDGVEVAALSGGKTNGTATSRIGINKALLNPETGAPYQAGETVGVQYYDETTKTWKYLPTADYVVQSYTNPPNSDILLYVDAQITGSQMIKLWYRSGYSWWSNWGLYVVAAELANSNVPIVTSGNLITITQLPGTTINYVFKLDGSFISSTSFWRNPCWVFFGPAGMTNISTTGNFGAGYTYSEQAEFNAGRFNVLWTEVDHSGSSVALGYTLQCRGAFIQPPVGVVMLYREHDPNGTAPFDHLYTFTDPNVSSHSFTKLEDGKYYDFRAQLASDVIDTSNVLVEDGKIYNVILPKRLCNKIGF